MKYRMPIILILLTSLLIAIIAQAQHGYVRMRPATRIGIAPRPPGPGRASIWIGPEWTWNNGAYIQTPGYWAPSRQGFVWVAGKWILARRGWVWMPGYWIRR